MYSICDVNLNLVLSKLTDAHASKCGGEVEIRGWQQTGRWTEVREGEEEGERDERIKPVDTLVPLPD